MKTHPWQPDVFKCFGSVPGMNLGGSASGQFQMGRPQKVNFNRPQFKVSDRRKASTEKWTACGGTQNCFYGKGLDRLEAVLSENTWDTVAVEFATNCEIKTTIKILYQERMWWKPPWMNHKRFYSEEWRRNADIKIFYNLAEVTEPPTNQGYGNMGWNVPISSGDTNPLLRIEVSRRNKWQSASIQLKVRVTHVTPLFEKCMDMKQQHGQCLEDLATTGTSELRSNHKLQLACVDGSNIDTPGCREWLKCLPSTSKAVIANVAKGLALLAVPAVLVQTQSRPQCRTGSGLCYNPSTIDIEAFDCNCFDWVVGKSPEQIHAVACGKPEVCCDWKDSHGCPATSTNLLQEGNKETNGQTDLIESESTMHLRSQKEEKDTQDDTSLDDSLSGKRTCDSEE